MKPKELLYSHRYGEAVEAYEKEMRIHPEKNLYAPLGHAFMGLEQFRKAKESFERDNEIENGRLKGSFPSISKIGTSLWLMKRNKDALSVWHHAVVGILDGTVVFGDAAGGGTQGLLLWYGSIALVDKQERDFALNYLRSLTAKRAPAVSWPRPVIEMVLHETTVSNVLQACFGQSAVQDCLERASEDLLSRRRLSQILFYKACQLREEGDETGCVDWIRLCAQLENPILQSEWYLARGESKLGKLNETGT